LLERNFSRRARKEKVCSALECFELNACRTCCRRLHRWSRLGHGPTALLQRHLACIGSSTMCKRSSSSSTNGGPENSGLEIAASVQWAAGPGQSSNTFFASGSISHAPRSEQFFRRPSAGRCRPGAAVNLYRGHFIKTEQLHSGPHETVSDPQREVVAILTHSQSFQSNPSSLSITKIA
jgi:hypothetical protein